MNIAIVGSGHIGGNLGRLWARAGHKVFFSFSRDREKLERLAREAGNGAAAVSPYDAVSRSEVVLFSPPWTQKEAAIKQMGRFDEKLVIDTTNPYIDAEMHVQRFDDGSSSSEYVAKLLHGARLVKAFNTLHARTLVERSGEGLVIFMASDFPLLKRSIAEPLIRDAGFVPYDVGPLVEGKHQEPGTERYLKELTLDQARRLVEGSGTASTVTGEIGGRAQERIDA